MNAIDLLKYDHQNLQQLFSEYFSVEDADFDRLGSLFEEIETKLLAHTEAEEKLFYPQMKQYAPDFVKRATAEHQEMNQLLVEMVDLNIDDDEFESRLETLQQRVQNHVEEEEGPNGLFLIASEKLSAQELADIGRQIQQVRKHSESELAA